MATPVALTTDSDTTNATSYTTASIAPTAGRLILVSFMVSVGSGTTPTPVVTGCGLTWEQVNQSATATRTVHMFRAMGTPTPGPITIASSGIAYTSCLWNVSEISGADTSGTNGSGAIVQVIDSRPGSATSVDVPFGATVGEGNVVVGAVATAAQVTPTAGGGWTALGGTNQSAPTSGLLVEAATPAQQDITASWAGAANSFIVGAEIKAAAGGQGSAAGTWKFTGAATGRRTPVATGAGTWTFAGAATGKRDPVGSAAGNWSFTGFASGGTPKGSAAGTWSFAGAAAGSRPAVGSGASSWAFIGAAVGEKPTVEQDSNVEVWNGSAWTAIAPLVWNGAAWVPIDPTITT